MLKTSQLDFPEVSVLWILIAYFSDLSDLLNTFLMLHFFALYLSLQYSCELIKHLMSTRDKVAVFTFSIFSLFQLPRN